MPPVASYSPQRSKAKACPERSEGNLLLVAASGPRCVFSKVVIILQAPPKGSHGTHLRFVLGQINALNPQYFALCNKLNLPVTVSYRLISPQGGLLTLLDSGR
jgi:hypothetical protein